MKNVKNIILYLTILILFILNIYQWNRSRHVSARQAIVKAWNDDIFINDNAFHEFQNKITSQEFISPIINKRKYKSIREKFLKDWNPNATRQRVSDSLAPNTLYWGRERTILNELINDIYAAIGSEIDHYRSQRKEDIQVLVEEMP